MGYISFKTRESPATTGIVSGNPEKKDLAFSPELILVNFSEIKPGDLTTINLDVSNNGKTDVFYYIYAIWGLSDTSTEQMGVYFSKFLVIDITAGSEAENKKIYRGSLFELLDKPDSPGRNLPSEKNENIQINIFLPPDLPGYLKGIDIHIEFIFVILQ